MTAVRSHSAGKASPCCTHHSAMPRECRNKPTWAFTPTRTTGVSILCEPRTSCGPSLPRQISTYLDGPCVPAPKVGPSCSNAMIRYRLCGVKEPNTRPRRSAVIISVSHCALGPCSISGILNAPSQALLISKIPMHNAYQQQSCSDQRIGVDCRPSAQSLLSALRFAARCTPNKDSRITIALSDVQYLAHSQA